MFFLYMCVLTDYQNVLLKQKYISPLLLFLPATETILCHKCNSGTDKFCESRPPTPEPCQAISVNMKKACSTVKIMDKVTSKS